jgi:hypothetical protein
MGPGCKTVARVHTKDTELVTGVWNDGRVGTFRGIRKGKSGYGGVVFGTKGIVPFDSSAGYQPLVEEICKFFRTGQPPVSAEETLEIYTFMEAADESKRRGGAPVTLESVLAKARVELRKPDRAASFGEAWPAVAADKPRVVQLWPDNPEKRLLCSDREFCLHGIYLFSSFVVIVHAEVSSVR